MNATALKRGDTLSKQSILVSFFSYLICTCARIALVSIKVSLLSSSSSYTLTLSLLKSLSVTQSYSSSFLGSCDVFESPFSVSSSLLCAALSCFSPVSSHSHLCQLEANSSKASAIFQLKKRFLESNYIPRSTPCSRFLETASC